MSFTAIVCSVVLIGVNDAAADHAPLTRQIDTRIDEKLAANQIAPAPLADDAEFARRVYVDLVGFIPTEGEIREFLADVEVAKRAHLIDRLLADPRHFDHFARTWRRLLLPEAETDPQVDYLRPGLEAWLRERRERNDGFDQIVRELISVPIAAPGGLPEIVLRDLRRPNALGYFAAKEAKPENLAASTTRLFLGVRLECAQCHNHPFGHWTQTQFWNQAAFFAGLERRGQGVFAPLIEVKDRRDTPIIETTERASAVLLNGETPGFADGESSRNALAAWITSSENDQFARATVNRMWGQMMGLGIVEPVDDFHDAAVPSHPELLDELAKSFVAAKFDLTYLLRAICNSNAYQRTSRVTHESQVSPGTYARMAVKQMSAEQLVDSLWLALGHPAAEDSLKVGRDRDRVRQKYKELFADSDKFHDPLTTIQQALTLSNGSLVNDSIDSASSLTLKNAIEKTELPVAERLESMYLSTLGRAPSTEELGHLTTYVQHGSPEEMTRRWGDVFWMLLNCVEFRCNH